MAILLGDRSASISSGNNGNEGDGFTQNSAFYAKCYATEVPENAQGFYSDDPDFVDYCNGINTIVSQPLTKTAIDKQASGGKLENGNIKVPIKYSEPTCFLNTWSDSQVKLAGSEDISKEGFQISRDPSGKAYLYFMNQTNSKSFANLKIAVKNLDESIVYEPVSELESFSEVDCDEASQDLETYGSEDIPVTVSKTLSK